jgi:hypothetical protein
VSTKSLISKKTAKYIIIKETEREKVRKGSIETKEDEIDRIMKSKKHPSMYSNFLILFRKKKGINK